MITLVNLTPHPVVLCDGEGRAVVTIAPSGMLARCSAERQVVGAVVIGGMNVPLTMVVVGVLQGLPDPAEDTLFIASRIACEAAKSLGRADVVCPDDAVRDADGKIVGVKSLARL